MRVFGDYLIRYNDCLEEGDHFPKLIELLDLKTGEITHRGWTPTFYIEENPQDENGLNKMDEVGIIRFSYQVMDENLLLGQRRGRIYVFGIVR